ncbi:MAG: YfcE family phosphodiesterase [Deltaproteobacteria bacterium]|nr:YfcE family phosphodiesterase [Deltaproteobacteria bacterium]MBW2051103.1 YfcE family phosphodiesterase [Deltaproteobacteria bacterium]MBW2141712.1 YfcE family phosphodiesterase [Deltaproteobacteria bacterium]MBW2323597.1 YfcE family phosphodiesterase [Deltaproteobacteria bacterium]
MKIAVISDSHGETENVRLLADRLSPIGIKHIVHLGDDYDDADVLTEAGYEVLRVPGVFSGYYQDPGVPNRLLAEFGGLRVLLTHAGTPHKNDRPEDKDPAELAREEKPDMVLFGHSHLPAIEERDDILWVNPGHLKSEDKKGAPPSYALIDTEPSPVKIQILSLEDDRVILER